MILGPVPVTKMMAALASSTVTATTNANKTSSMAPHQTTQQSLMVATYLHLVLADCRMHSCSCEGYLGTLTDLSNETFIAWFPGLSLLQTFNQNSNLQPNIFTTVSYKLFLISKIVI